MADKILVLGRELDTYRNDSSYNVAFIYVLPTPVLDANGTVVVPTPLDSWRLLVPDDAKRGYLTSAQRDQFDTGVAVFELVTLQRPEDSTETLSQYAKRIFLERRAQFVLEVTRRYEMAGMIVSVPSL